MTEDGWAYAVGRTGEESSYSRHSDAESNDPITGVAIERSGEPNGPDSAERLISERLLPMVSFDVQQDEPVITPTKIQGLPANVYSYKATCRVTWKAVDGSTMSVTVAKADDVPADLCSAAKKVAGSLLPDSETTVTPGIAANWIPEGWRAMAAGVEPGGYQGTSAGCRSWFVAKNSDGAEIVVSLDRGEVARLNPPLKIRGRNAYVVETPNYMGELQVDLGGGRRLSINQDQVVGSHRMTHDEIVKMAENVAVGPEPTCPGG
jgi:hypothetical protein